MCSLYSVHLYGDNTTPGYEFEVLIIEHLHIFCIPYLFLSLAVHYWTIILLTHRIHCKIPCGLGLQDICQKHSSQSSWSAACRNPSAHNHVSLLRKLNGSCCTICLANCSHMGEWKAIIIMDIKSLGSFSLTSWMWPRKAVHFSWWTTLLINYCFSSSHYICTVCMCAFVALYHQTH